MHARVVYTWCGKSVLFREVSSVQECPHKERGSTAFLYIFLSFSSYLIYLPIVL